MRIAEKYVIIGVDLWNSDGIEKNCDVHIENGKVTSIVEAGAQVYQGTKILASGKVLIPGGVDPQVHLRTPGQPEKETPETGCNAAVRGGVTAMLTMPNTIPVIDSPEIVSLTKDYLSASVSKTGVLVAISAAITCGQKGKQTVDFLSLARAGVAAFTDDGVGVVNNEHMRKAFRASADIGLPILQHCEFPGHGGNFAEGPILNKLGGKSYPPEAESEMVARDLNLLNEFPGARYHVLHVSSSKTLDLIAKGKENGLAVTCEVSPHHLFFNNCNMDSGNAAFKMNPPLRSEFDRSALVSALRNGICDFVATDHAPHQAEIKSRLASAAYGTTGLETSLRCLLTLLYQGEMSKHRLVEVFSTSPAKFLGLSSTEGLIANGRPLRAVLVDKLDESTTVTEHDLASRSHNNCFLGAKLNGQVVSTFMESRIFEHKMIQ
ncbi:MAG: dihydroorotase [Oligoflexales bacterium]